VSSIRPLAESDREDVLTIVNSAAQAYRGVIPEDRWRDPYMTRAEMDREVEAGVRFWGYERDNTLLGVMGVQDAGEVELIRHAYVAPAAQRSGIGHALLEHLASSATRPILVGTWATAAWAIRFYERNGFRLEPPRHAAELLRAYWDIPERQIETSVVLSRAAEPTARIR
jgi:GNAT superfamily N-acetyltransferase